MDSYRRLPVNAYLVLVPQSSLCKNVLGEFEELLLFLLQLDGSGLDVDAMLARR